MIRRHVLSCCLALLFAVTAAAQPQSIFDPDDFIPPNRRAESLFISRLVVGVAMDLVDGYRPLHQDAGFVHVANSFYWRGLQIDYKHSDGRAGKVNGPAVVTQCGCNAGIYFPTPPPSNATPAAPLPSPKETTQVAFYAPSPASTAQSPTMLRYRFSWSYQRIETVIHSATSEPERLSGREQSFGLDADTHFRIAGRNLFGSLVVARTVLSGTTGDRAQTEVLYTNRSPVLPIRKLLVGSTLTVGSVSGRGATGLNVVNPAIEAFWHHDRSAANFHLIYSPQALRSGAEGWRIHHQIAFYVDRALYVHLFRRSTPGNTAPAPPDQSPTGTGR